MLTTNPTVSTYADSIGWFCFNKVPVGRHDIEISSIGYEPTVIKEISLTSAKESFNDVSLKERFIHIGEVVVGVGANKEKPLNLMALSGARMISIEEASRYAGGFGDPARLVSANSRNSVLQISKRAIAKP